MRFRLSAILAGFLVLTTATAQAQNKRDDKVKEDRKNVSELGDWNYNDLPAGMAEAKKTGKPLLIVFR